VVVVVKGTRPGMELAHDGPPADVAAPQQQQRSSLAETNSTWPTAQRRLEVEDVVRTGVYRQAQGAVLDLILAG
jgi:hypothetical protein